MIKYALILLDFASEQMKELEEYRSVKRKLRQENLLKRSTYPPRNYIQKNNKGVHLVLHPHGIAPNFLKLDSWSLGVGFIHIISPKGINQIKKGKLK